MIIARDYQSHGNHQFKKRPLFCLIRMYDEGLRRDDSFSALKTTTSSAAHYSTDVEWAWFQISFLLVYKGKWEIRFYNHISGTSLGLSHLLVRLWCLLLPAPPCCFLDDLEILTNWPTRLVVPAVSWDHHPSFLQFWSYTVTPKSATLCFFFLICMIQWRLVITWRIQSTGSWMSLHSWKKIKFSTVEGCFVRFPINA